MTAQNFNGIIIPASNSNTSHRVSQHRLIFIRTPNMHKPEYMW